MQRLQIEIFKPHFVKKLQRDSIDEKYRKPNHTTIDSIHFEPVVEGMSNVVKWGTARIARVPGVEVCRKTGTAENFVRIKGEKVQLTDHSMFVAFGAKRKSKNCCRCFCRKWILGAMAMLIASLVIENISLVMSEELPWKIGWCPSLVDEYQAIERQTFEINE